MIREFLEGFVKARHLGTFLVLCGVLTLVTGLAAGRTLAIPGASDGAGVPLSIPVATIAPLLFTVIVTYFQRSALLQPEEGAARRIRVWRYGYCLALTLVGLGALASVTQHLEGPLGTSIVLRNYLGMVAIGFLCSALVGPSYGWIGITAVSIGFLSAFGGVDWNPFLSRAASPPVFLGLVLLVLVTAAAAARAVPR